MNKLLLSNPVTPGAMVSRKMPTVSGELPMRVTENHIITLMPRRDRRQLLAACQVVELESSEILSSPNTPTQFAYFPIDGIISLIAPVADRNGPEVSMVGCEGMLGVHLALGVDISPMRALVQRTGKAWRIEVRTLKNFLDSSKELQHILDRYIYVLMTQLATSSVCFNVHQANQRLARWLLMRLDRAQTDTIGMTHEVLAGLLDMRRVTITKTAGAMQRSGLIHYHRGKITVLDRPGLEMASCDCYAQDQETYARQLVR